MRSLHDEYLRQQDAKDAAGCPGASRNLPTVIHVSVFAKRWASQGGLCGSNAA